MCDGPYGVSGRAAIRGTLALALLIGGPFACNEPDDDDTLADDDASGDDDSGDDDDSVAWTDVLPEVDPEGDQGGYLLDLRNLQAGDGEELALRTTSWDSFDDGDSGLWLGVTVGDAGGARRLTWDGADDPSLQLWSSANRWAAPVAAPASLTWEPDLEIALVLAADFQDLGLGDRCELWARVEAGCSADGCADVAPDDGAPAPFTVDAGLPATLAARQPSFDDAGGGNGDGVLDPGEYVQVEVALANLGCDPSGSGVTAQLSVHPDSTTSAALLADSVAYGDDPLAPGDEVAPDAALELALGAGAEPGQTLVLQLEVTDGDGGSWTAVAPPLIVGKPREEALAQVLVDEDDADTAFDTALVTYGIVAGELQITVFSYGVHQGDQAVEVHLDVDLDGQPDHILSTLDPDTGAFTGSVRTFDPWAGWRADDPLSSLTFDAGSDSVQLGVPLVQLGDPSFALLVQVTVADADGEVVDRAPDDPIPGDIGPMGLIATVDAPFLRFAATQLEEISGDGDGDVEPGERWSLKVQLRNDGPSPAVDAAGALSSPDPSLTVIGGDLSFGPADPDGGTCWSLTAAEIDLDPAAPSGATVELALPLSVAGYSFSVPVPLAVE